MAKKVSKAKPAKKRAAKKRGVKRMRSTDVQLSPKQRAKALKQIRKLASGPSHPTEDTGPVLELGYDAPLPVAKKARKKVAKKKAAKKAAKKRKAKS
jgi:hypothetical protein